MSDEAIKEIRDKLDAESRSPSLKTKMKFSLLDPKNVAYRKSYIGTQYDFLGLASPQEKLVYGRGYSFVSDHDFEELLKIWTHVFTESGHFHVMGQALTGAGDLIDQARDEKRHVFFLKTFTPWLSRLDNWAHSDGVSSVLAQLLDLALEMKNQKLIRLHLKLRAKWNRSKNAWERRQSIVSLLYYASSRSHYLPFKTMAKLVEPLVEDDAFYVQRGVGWTLRELHNVYPKEAFAFMKKHIRILSSIAFSAATEKLSAAKKKQLLALRKSK